MKNVDGNALEHIRKHLEQTMDKTKSVICSEVFYLSLFERLNKQHYLLLTLKTVFELKK